MVRIPKGWVHYFPTKLYLPFHMELFYGLGGFHHVFFFVWLLFYDFRIMDCNCKI